MELISRYKQKIDLRASSVCSLSQALIPEGIIIAMLCAEFCMTRNVAVVDVDNISLNRNDFLRDYMTVSNFSELVREKSVHQKVIGYHNPDPHSDFHHADNLVSL